MQIIMLSIITKNTAVLIKTTFPSFNKEDTCQGLHETNIIFLTKLIFRQNNDT